MTQVASSTDEVPTTTLFARGPAIRRAHGLNLHEAMLLIVLERRPCRNDGDILTTLAARIGLSSAGLTRMADRLEARGLVVKERHGVDLRCGRLALTDDGQTLARTLLAELP